MGRTFDKSLFDTKSLDNILEDLQAVEEIVNETGKNVFKNSVQWKQMTQQV